MSIEENTKAAKPPLHFRLLQSIAGGDLVIETRALEEELKETKKRIAFHEEEFLREEAGRIEQLQRFNKLSEAVAVMLIHEPSYKTEHDEAAEAFNRVLITYQELNNYSPIVEKEATAE